MFTFIKQKLLYKKWLNICLLIGIILLLSIAVCLPMYQDMAKTQTLQVVMKQYIQEQQKYPALLSLSGGFTIKKGEDVLGSVKEKIEGFEEILDSEVAILPSKRILLLTLKEKDALPLDNAGGSRNDMNCRLTVLSDFEEHMKMVAGNYYKTSEEVSKQAKPEKDVISLDANSKYTCVVSAALLEKSKYYVGQTLEFDDYVCKNGKPLQITITGVFEEKESEGSYWVNPPLWYTTHLFVSEEMMSEILDDIALEEFSIQYTDHNLYEYNAIKSEQVEDLYNAFDHLIVSKSIGKNVELNTEFPSLMEAYMNEEKKISATLWILELPIIMLVLVFIYMLSSQILELEGNEIATLKSRGVSVRQIVWLYFCQSSLLASIAAIFSLPLGYGICRLLGQANAFLEFVNRKNLPVRITGEIVIYLVVAMIFAVACMTLPLVRIAREDIVQKKSKRGVAKEKPFFERYYLDVILLGISIYTYYSFQSQKEELIQKVMNGQGLDPILFFGATLFMLGLGMVLLRVFRLCIHLVYRMGEKKWSPAMYASFLQILRTPGKQGFISLFLIVALAMGVFYSNVARTINQNEEERIRYNIGADVVVKEQWKKTSYTYEDEQAKRHTVFYEVEPDTDLAKQVSTTGNHVTKVIRENISIKSGKTLTEQAVLMGIQTKEFGEVAWMRERAMDQHWYHYLNLLAEKSDYILVSSNMAEDFGLKVGDTITYSPNDNDDTYKSTLSTITGTICGFVDVWPGYTGYVSVDGKSQKPQQEEVYITVIGGAKDTTEPEESTNILQEPQYLVIANYGFVEGASGTQQHELWINTDGDNEAIYDVLATSGSDIEYTKDTSQNIAMVKQSSLIQITNGMLTLSFLVVLILCMIGFLIYWITSIKQRELLFGIYRAMGMSMKEILQMLLNEQTFCSLLAIICGIISGVVTSNIFISLITIAYAPEAHCLEYRLYTSALDMVRIGVVVVLMLGICIFVLSKMLKGMKIAQALKLGED